MIYDNYFILAPLCVLNLNDISCFLFAVGCDLLTCFLQYTVFYCERYKQL